MWIISVALHGGRWFRGLVLPMLGWACVVVFLLSFLLRDGRRSRLSSIAMCIGAVGLPVFANMAAGVQVLTGMTAGFLWAYPLMAALLAAVCRRTQRMALRLAGVLAGQLVCYALGIPLLMLLKRAGAGTKLFQ